MLYANDFRRIARDAIRGRWGLAIITGLVAGLLGGVSCYRFPQPQWREEYGNNGLLHTEVGHFLLLILISLAGALIVYGIVLFFIGGAVTLGYVRFNRNLLDRNNPQFMDLFSRFDMFWQGFLMQLLITIYTVLWTLLFVIPGIIAAFSYAMTPYILEENPGMPVNEAIRCSKNMMRGNKWRLFCLEISFIGWYFLCLFTCGIGFLWLVPYTSTARAAFFYEVSGKFRAAQNQQFSNNYAPNGQ